MRRELPPLRMLAIYDRPRDYPTQIVVRSWMRRSDGSMVPDTRVQTFDITMLTYRGAMSAARSHCKGKGLTFLPRDPNDDPVLIETWQGKPEADAAE